MKVLFLTNNPNLGSTARILQIWCEELPKHGHSVRVVCPPGSLADALRERGVSVRTSTLPWFDWRTPWHAAAEAARVAWWARGVDVVHCNEHNVYPFGAFVARFLRRPAVCHVRFDLGADFARWAFGRFGPPAALMWTSYYQQSRCASAVEGIVGVERQHVVRLGLDVREFGNRRESRAGARQSWGVTDDVPVIGTASAFRPIKRLEDFVELIARVRTEHPRVVGVIAGGPVAGLEDYWNRIDALIRERDAATWILRTGNLLDVEPFLQGLDLFVSTSELETFGNSVCEAMVCGKTVVAYAGGSVAEVVGDAGMIVPNGDIDGMTKHVLQLLKDPQRLANLGMLGRQRVMEEFDAVARVPEIVEVYCSIVPHVKRTTLQSPAEASVQ